ncbi:MAG: Mrp/NBP35 family ATP-binding protein [Anaplasma sp.]
MVAFYYGICNMPTGQEVIDSLQTVTDPETDANVSGIGKFSVTINGGHVGVIFETPGQVTKSWEQRFKEKCEHAVTSKVAGVTNVTVALVRKNARADKVKVRGVRSILLIASGKGGVGKSTLATQIALSLARRGSKVALVDADIYGSSIPYLLGTMTKVQMDDAGMIVPKEALGLKSISISNLVADARKAILWRGPMLTKAITQLIMGTRWGEIDYMIVDTPPGTGDVHISLATNFIIDGAVVISTPHELSVLQVMKTCDMLRSLDVRLLGIVENMSYLVHDASGERIRIFGMGGAREVAQLTDIPFLGDIRIDSRICQVSGENGPSVLDGELMSMYDEITQNMLEGIH